MARLPVFLAGLLLLCLCSIAIAEAEYIKYKDPKQPLNTRIKDLMSRMTLEEKIGQMVQIDRRVASAEVMKKDPQLVKRIGAATALEVRATGIPYVFAPCIAVCRDPRWGRCYESYSEDPKIVQAMSHCLNE
ncbi:hypothetical protein ACE6H2_022755 [Prunus campanulata]